MANRLSDQEALEFQFQGTFIDPAKVDADARVLGNQIQDSIEAQAEAEAARYKKRCELWPGLPQCNQSPPPLTMEEYEENLTSIFEANSKFNSLLGKDDLDIPEGTILVDPVDDFFLDDGPAEYYEAWVDALIPTLIITFLLAALALFLRDGIRRLLGRPKQRTGKWGIF
jgi:hypothetical protein